MPSRSTGPTPVCTCRATTSDDALTAGNSSGLVASSTSSASSFGYVDDFGDRQACSPGRLIRTIALPTPSVSLRLAAEHASPVAYVRRGLRVHHDLLIVEAVAAPRGACPGLRRRDAMRGRSRAQSSAW